MPAFILAHTEKISTSLCWLNYMSPLATFQYYVVASFASIDECMLCWQPAFEIFCSVLMFKCFFNMAK